ncbi:MAG: YceI family protein [Bacteroidetes bacterium]|nr:YceI family protein [Bacteroidota bacterium]
MKKQFVVLLVISFATIISVAQTAVKYGADKSKSYITYGMSHPMHEWEGTSKEMNSVLLYNTETKKIEKAAMAIPVATFDSQNANRDSHMIEVLDGIKFPNITFSSASITGDESKLSVTGNLVFHGVTKSVTFDALSKTTADGIEISGTFSVLMTDYNIEIPSMMGMPAKNEITLKFFALYKQK